MSLERTVSTESLLEMLSNKGDDKSLISGEYPDTTLDATLNYISKILLEDDLEEKEASLHEESAMTGSSYQQILPQESNSEVVLANDPDNNLVSDGSPDVTLDTTLSYINQLLLEKDIDEKTITYANESALHAVEKPFYDILDQKYLYPVDNPPPQNHTKPDLGFTVHNFEHPPGSTFGIQLSSEFNKGAEEGMRFLPRIDKLALGTEAKKLPLPLVPESDGLVKTNSVIDGGKNNEDLMGSGSMGKKKSDADLDILEARDRKILLPYFDEPPRNEIFDEVLLAHGNDKEFPNVQEVIQTSKYPESNQVESSNIKALLLECSHAVYTNDRQSAEGLLKQIRELASPDGDGTQRMAFAFADALEARLNGTGKEAWRQIVSRRFPTSEYLKVARLYITVCPFRRIAIYYANRTILKLTEKVSKLHIIDFGIGCGFQWPSLIQALSSNNNCKSKLRITGIDFPLPGFRPADQIEETGRRLKAYAESFDVPFEYHAIASKWEDVSVDDLKIREDEVLIVTCLNRFNEVGDEAVSLDSPRDRVLDLIRQIKPYVFIEGIINITAFSPYFIPRVKQGLALYSAIFELLDTLIPRDNKQRKFVECNVLARNMLNVFACEGSDWIIKFETYKQWHMRNLRAGLKPIPLDPVIVKECKEILKRSYNSNFFFIDQDRNWLLQGWNGRAYHTISTWNA